MNIVLLDPRQTESDLWNITASRQLEHLKTRWCFKKYADIK